MEQAEPFLQFRITGPIVPKGRPRLGRNHVYTPKSTTYYEREIAITASLQMGGHELLQCPVRLDILASFVVPKSFSKRLKADLLGKPYAGRVDWDNIGKVVSDALNGIVWTDDRHVAIGQVSKIFALENGLQVTIWKL